MKQNKNQLHKRLNWKTVWHVVGEFSTKHMGTQHACEFLGISRAQLYRLRKRWFELYEQKGSPDWLYQRPGTGKSRLPIEVQSYLEEECRYIKEQSEFFKDHFNFSFLSQQIQQRYKKKVDRSTVRRWAIQQKLYNPQTDTTGKAYLRFEMGGLGMLLQHDSSIHLWLPKTNRKDILILTIDDHSRKVLYAKLVPRDSVWHHLCSARHIVETYGIGLCYYVDNHSIFKPDTELYTQFGRALHSLEIDLKFHEKRQAQAKGKVEKRFDYFQRRIPYLCERYHITSLTKANKILDQEVAFFNECHVHAETLEIPDKRWTRAIDEDRNYFRPLPPKTPLDIIFAIHYDRMLKKDGSFGFNNQRFVIPRAPRYAKVTLALRPPTGPRRPHTELYVLHKGSTLKHLILPRNTKLPPR